MIESAALAQADYLSSRPEDTRKSLGQYFTTLTIANYMASMINSVDAPQVRILDAGAGAGILTLAAALRCLEMGKKHVHAVLYEIDNGITQLKLNMEQLAQTFQKQEGLFTYEMRHKDFVKARPDKTDDPFHISSINPPYFKYSSKSSPYADATKDLFKGNPNIYASFMAIVSACLAPMGQMIAIVPRSFTNGLYFKGFRYYLNENMSLDRLHIFQSRDKVFKDLPVLQENIICSYTKRPQIAHIEVATSNGYEDLGYAEIRRYPSALLIDTTNEHRMLRIPESDEEAAILQTVERWPSSFCENGYFISTGPVVEHRTKDFITKPNQKKNCVPLLRMHNIKAFQTIWTGRHRKDVCFRLLPGYDNHTSLNKTYVLLKRFSSKDEKRRLVAGIYTPQDVPKNVIAIENHLNYIGRKEGELELAEAFGLAALLNSTLMDKYFRCISGNTQVNATEIRTLKLPNTEVIYQIGEYVMERTGQDQEYIDNIVNLYLQIN